jgi:sterol 3beta-glucosyltransferase
MASEERTNERVGRKLTKKRRSSKRVSLDIPERFKDGADAEDDVTAPKKSNAVSMNQSIFSMIARAGQQSQTDLGRMEEVDSGDSDEEGKQKIPYHSLDGAARVSRLSSAHDFQTPPQNGEDSGLSKKQHKRTMSEHKLLRSLPKLRMSNKKESKSEAQPADLMSSSQFLPPRSSKDEATAPSHGEPSLGHKSKVIPGQEIHVEKRRTTEPKSNLGSTSNLTKGKGSVPLAERLQRIFEFEDVEEVISGTFVLVPLLVRSNFFSEYPCWLLQSILLQGYMYITQKHICFYAYIPRKHVRHLNGLLVRY